MPALVQPQFPGGCSPYWLSRGLVGFVIPRFPDELAKSRPITLTTVTVADDAYGVCYSLSATYPSYASVTVPEVAAPREWSVIALAKSTSVAAGTGIIVNLNYDGTTVPVSLSLNNTGSPAGASVYAGAWNTTASGMTDFRNDNLWHTFGGVFLQGSRLEFWVDGAINASNSSTTQNPSTHTNTNALNVGAYINNSWTFGGLIAAVALFNRALRNIDMVTLTERVDAIWQIANVPPRPLRFAPTVAAAPRLPLPILARLQAVNRAGL
jgi:hypothetical protein